MQPTATDTKNRIAWLREVRERAVADRDWLKVETIDDVLAEITARGGRPGADFGSSITRT